PKNVIMDEYMFFTNKKNLKAAFAPIFSMGNLAEEEKSLFIFSSSNKVYSKELVEQIRELKKNGMYFEKFIENREKALERKITKQEIEEIEDLYWSYLTDADTILIDDYYNPDYYNNAEKKKILYGDRYDLEVLNKYLV